MIEKIQKFWKGNSFARFVLSKPLPWILLAMAIVAIADSFFGG